MSTNETDAELDRQTALFIKDVLDLPFDLPILAVRMDGCPGGLTLSINVLTTPQQEERVVRFWAEPAYRDAEIARITEGSD